MAAVNRYFRQHISLYLFVAVLFLMGVVFGALMVNALSLQQKQEMSQYLGSFFHMMDQSEAGASSQTIWEATVLQLKWLVLIWLAGLSIVGLPIIFALDFVKGVLIGFTVGYIVGQYSWKGLLFALVSVAPQNLLIIPALLITSVSAVTFSLYMIRNRLLQRQGSFVHPFAVFGITTGGMAIFMLGSACIEIFVSPSLMRWVAPMLSIPIL